MKFLILAIFCTLLITSIRGGRYSSRKKYINKKGKNWDSAGIILLNASKDRVFILKDRRNFWDFPFGGVESYDKDIKGRLNEKFFSIKFIRHSINCHKNIF